VTVGEILIIFATISAIGIVVQYFPHKKFAKILSMPHGPRTDTKYMIRRELVRSGKTLLSCGIILAVVWIAFSRLTFSSIVKDSPLPFIIGIHFAVSLTTLASILGGIYLLVRSLFRSENYLPPPGEDESKR
jgi:hypothetical protein